VGRLHPAVQDAANVHLSRLRKLHYFERVEQVPHARADGPGPVKSQIIVTTHDRMMIGSLRKEQVRILRPSRDGSVEVATPLVDPRGMGFAGLLKSELFGLRATVDFETLRRLDRRNLLFAKRAGPHAGRDGGDGAAERRAIRAWLRPRLQGPVLRPVRAEVAQHTEFHVPTLTPEQRAEQDAIAGRIISEVLGDDDGGWWLAFDYSNYRICGSVGNAKKGGWFPLRPGSMRSCYAHQCEESETHYLLDPTDPADADLLAFDEEGNAIPAPDATAWDEQRVEESIKRLKLNEHEALAEARRAIWQQVVREADGFLRAKSRCCAGANPAAQQKMREHARRLKQMAREEAQFSSVVRWCLTFRNEPQLMRLATCDPGFTRQRSGDPTQRSECAASGRLARRSSRTICRRSRARKAARAVASRPGDQGVPGAPA